MPSAGFRTASLSPAIKVIESTYNRNPLNPGWYIAVVELNPHLRELSSVNLNIFTFLANSKQIDRAVTRFLLL